MRKRAWIGLAGAALLAGGLPAVFGISPAGAGTVQGLQAHVNHILVLMQENRSVGLTTSASSTPRASPPTRPSPHRQPRPAQPAERDHAVPQDGDLRDVRPQPLVERHAPGVERWGDGRLHRGQRQLRNRPDRASRAMGYYDQTDLPFYYELVQHVRHRRPLLRVGADPDVPQPLLPAGGDVVRPHPQRLSARRRLHAEDDLPPPRPDRHHVEDLLRVVPVRELFPTCRSTPRPRLRPSRSTTPTRRPASCPRSRSSTRS